MYVYEYLLGFFFFFQKTILSNPKLWFLVLVLDVTAWFFRICWNKWLSSANCSWQKMHEDCNRRKSNDVDDEMVIGKDRGCGNIMGCFRYELENDGGIIRWEFPLNIARKIWSEVFCWISLIINESFFDKSIVDDTAAVGYSWTVSEMVDEEVFVERESERDEHRGCFGWTDLDVEDEAMADPLDGWGLCHRRCEAKLAGQLNVLSHSGQLNHGEEILNDRSVVWISTYRNSMCTTRGHLCIANAKAFSYLILHNWQT